MLWAVQYVKMWNGCNVALHCIFKHSVTASKNHVALLNHWDTSLSQTNQCRVNPCDHICLRVVRLDWYDGLNWLINHTRHLPDPLRTSQLYTEYERKHPTSWLSRQWHTGQLFNSNVTNRNICCVNVLKMYIIQLALNAAHLHWWNKTVKSHISSWNFQFETLQMHFVKKKKKLCYLEVSVSKPQMCPPSKPQLFVFDDLYNTNI